MAECADDPYMSAGGVRVGIVGILLAVDCPGDAAGLEPVTIGLQDLRVPSGLV